MSLSAPTEDTTTEPDVPVLSRLSGWAMVVWGLLGLAAAASLTVDKFKILEDPSFEPSCNFNPVLSCGSVMVTHQASAFGFPNPILGLVGFSVVITLGVLVASGVALPRFVLTGVAAGSVAGLVFVHWLAFQSLYRIGALCPWCMVVWAVTLPTALWSVLAAARSYDSPGLRRVADGLWAWRFTILACWYLLVVVLALIRFWDYWSTLV